MFEHKPAESSFIIDLKSPMAEEENRFFELEID